MYTQSKIKRNVKFSNLKTPYIGTSYNNIEVESFINKEKELEKF